MKKIRLFLTGLFLLVASAAFAQNIQVTGTVTDAATGETIPYASIQIKGTLTGTETLDDGTFTISAPSNGVLLFQIIGYQPMEVAINGRKKLNVTLSADAVALEETVVIGYGSAKKVGTTVGSLTKVSSKNLESRPQASALESLQGQVAGLQIYTNDGEPGTLQSIRLHGVGSLNAGQSPLYILDGVAVDAAAIRAMNPNDIESMNVLKDASATSIYGSRAANGVIYVVSKKGRSGDSKISVRGQFGVSSLADWTFYDSMMSTNQLFDFWSVSGVKKDAAIQSIKDRLAKEGMVQSDGSLYDFSWPRYLLKTNRPIWQADISISGGSDRTSYYVSGAVYDEKGIAPGSFYKRYSFRTNVTSRVNSWFKLGANVQLSYDDRKTNGFFGGNNTYGGLSFLLQPYISPENSPRDQIIPVLDMWNPYYLVEIQPNSTQGFNADISGRIEIEPIRNLKFSCVPGIGERLMYDSYEALPVGPFVNNGTRRDIYQNNYRLQISNTLEYSFSIKDKHNIMLLVGHEGISEGTDYFYAKSEGQTDPRLMHLQNGLQEKYVVSSQDIRSNFLSFLGRAEYNYDNRLFFDANIRNDASSRFSSNHQNATFWAVGGMWNMKNEKFLREVNWLNSLNFKVSYGTQGNAAISDYQYQSLVSEIGNYGGAPGWGIATPGNDDLKWEVQSKLTVAVNARLWDIVNVGIEYYNRATDDMLMIVPKPSTSGFSELFQNVGAMTNNGLDLTLGFDILKGRDYYLGANLNFNYNKEKITRLFDGKNRWLINGTFVTYVVGESVSYYMPIYAGVDPNDGRMMWYLPGDNVDECTMDPNRVTKDFDEAKLTQNTGEGRYAPIAGGFNLNGSWRGIGLSADFSYVIGKTLISNDRFFSENPYKFSAENTSSYILDYWKNPGDVVDYPDWTKRPQMQFDTHLMENASFLRLKNLTVSYTLPTKYLNNSKSLHGFKAFFTARNLFTVTSKDFKGLDPEVDLNLTLGKVSNTRQFQLGVELTF